MDIKARRLHVPSHAHGQDSAQSGVVPRRQGPWVPSPSRHWGLWGPFPWCNTHAGKRAPFGHEWQLGRSLFGMPARGPSRPESSPLSLGRFWGRRPSFCARGRASSWPSGVDEGAPEAVGAPSRTHEPSFILKPQPAGVVLRRVRGEGLGINSLRPGCHFVVMQHKFQQSAESVFVPQIQFIVRVLDITVFATETDTHCANCAAAQ